MAASTFSVTTGSSDLVKLGRYVQGPLMKGFAEATPERQWHTKLEKFTLAPSQRSVTTPLDIKRGLGGASITEGGYESSPITPAPNELTFTYIHRHHSYTFSRTTEILTDAAGERIQVFNQMKYQARKIKQAMSEHFSMATYGYSTGIICLTSTNATATSGQAYTLIDAYGKSDLDVAAFPNLGHMIKVGDRVALVRSGALVTNAIGTVTAVSTSTPSATVTWAGSVDADANDAFVFAGSMENTTLAGGTDYNKWPVGLLDVVDTASIHGLSSSTEPLWASYEDTTGGRFGLVRLRALQYRIQNFGGGEPDLLICSQGVETDMTDNLQGAVRYNNSLAMQLDGATLIKGVDIRTSRWVPAGRAWLVASESLKLWEPAGTMPDENGVMPDSNNRMVITDKLENISGKKVGVDYIYARVFNNRGNIALASGLTEQ